ncbi:hypothetical protein BV22DRAFT_978464, partial [Leucogyrophana mollusca]
SQFILLLLSTPSYSDHPTVRDLLSNTREIMQALARHPSAYGKVLNWASEVVKAECAREVRELVKVQSGWHFSALHASADQMEEFQIGELAAEMGARAPQLWDLLDVLLSA